LQAEIGDLSAVEVKRSQVLKLPRSVDVTETLKGDSGLRHTFKKRSFFGARRKRLRLRESLEEIASSLVSLSMKTITRTAIHVFIVVVASLSVCRADAPDVFNATLPATVWVLDRDHGYSGSGAVIDLDRRVIVTAAHVVAESQDVTIVFPAWNSSGHLIDDRRVYLRPDNLRVLAARGYATIGHVIAADRVRDLALIQVPRLSRKARALSLASTAADPGETLYVVGHPADRPLWSIALGQLDRIGVSEWSPAGAKTSLRARAVVFYGQVWNGNSGGPVVNSRHELVGVLSSGDRRLTGVAIDASEVTALLGTVRDATTLTVAR
jgi:S1-C subfamily serine protease